MVWISPKSGFLIMSYPKEFTCHFVGVGRVIFHNARVLLVKLTYGPARGKWLIPGGLVDPGETLQEAVIREILEETRQDIKPLGLIGVRFVLQITLLISTVSFFVKNHLSP